MTQSPWVYLIAGGITIVLALAWLLMAARNAPSRRRASTYAERATEKADTLQASVAAARARVFTAYHVLQDPRPDNEFVSACLREAFIELGGRESDLRQPRQDEEIVEHVRVLRGGSNA